MSSNLTTILIAVIGLLGGGSGIALFVVPASKRFESLTTRVENLEKEVGKLREVNRFLSAGVAVLSQHTDSLCDWIERLDPKATPERSSVILERTKRDIANMERMEASQDVPNKS